MAISVRRRVVWMVPGGVAGLASAGMLGLDVVGLIVLTIVGAAVVAVGVAVNSWQRHAVDLDAQPDNAALSALLRGEPH